MSSPNVDPNEVSNALSELLPLKARKKLYAAFVLLGILAALVVAGFVAANAEVPVWLAVIVAVYNLASSFVTLLARANAGKAGLS